MIKYTFIGDGSSDQCLMRIINWSIEQLYPQLHFSDQYADLRHVRKNLKTLQEKIDKAFELYPCDIIFIHRDAEQSTQHEAIYSKRLEEIREAAQNFSYVPIIPIKMMETWLLTDISAIRKAAGNRSEAISISLPPINKLENKSDPKDYLYECLRKASALKGRRLNAFNFRQAVHLVAEYTVDFSTLRQLFSFQKFEDSLRIAVDSIGKTKK